MKDIINNIKYNALFSKVTESELEELLKHLNYSIEKYDKGTVIAQEDDNCSAIGLVLEGRVNIEKIYPSGKGIVMKKLSCGDVFGEALIFSKTTTYPATVMAPLPTRCFMMNSPTRMSYALVMTTTLQAQPCTVPPVLWCFTARIS